MEAQDVLSHKFEELGNYITTMLSEHNLKPIIEQAIVKTVSEHIQTYLNTNVKDFIQSLIKQEIDKVTEKFNSNIAQILDSHQKNADLLKSIQYHLAEKINPREVDRIAEALDRKEFNQAFDMILDLQDDQMKIRYLSGVNFEDMNLNNLDEDLAMRAGLWALGMEKVWRETLPLIERICGIIPKGVKLSELLRKIVGKGDKDLANARAIALKRSI